MTNKLYTPSKHSYDFSGGSDRGHGSPVYSDSDESYDFRKKRADGGSVEGQPMTAMSRNSSNLPPMKSGGAMHKHKR
jgi:hypothetical protein